MEGAADNLPSVHDYSADLPPDLLGRCFSLLPRPQLPVLLACKHWCSTALDHCPGWWEAVTVRTSTAARLCCQRGFQRQASQVRRLHVEFEAEEEAEEDRFSAEEDRFSSEEDNFSSEEDDFSSETSEEGEESSQDDGSSASSPASEEGPHAPPPPPSEELLAALRRVFRPALQQRSRAAPGGSSARRAGAKAALDLLAAASTAFPALESLALKLPNSSTHRDAALQATADLSSLRSLSLTLTGSRDENVETRQLSLLARLTSLQCLKLDLWNARGGLPASTLGALTALTHLGLSRRGVPFDVTEEFVVSWGGAGAGPRLRSLDLEYCTLAAPSASLASLSSLEGLCLRWAFSRELCEVLPQLPHLTRVALRDHVSLEDEEDAQLRGAVLRCPGLLHLEMTCSRPPELAPGTLRHLTHLELSANRLSGSWCDLPALESLRLQGGHGRHHKPPSNFTRLTSLRDLDLGSCGFFGCPRPLTQLPLTRLVLNEVTFADHKGPLFTDCHDELFPGPYLESLRELRLTGTDPRHRVRLPEGLDQATALKLLDLSDCCALKLCTKDIAVLKALPCLKRLLVSKPDKWGDSNMSERTLQLIRRELAGLQVEVIKQRGI